jgi:hypothetical protein
MGRHRRWYTSSSRWWRIVRRHRPNQWRPNPPRRNPNKRRTGPPKRVSGAQRSCRPSRLRARTTPRWRKRVRSLSLRLNRRCTMPDPSVSTVHLRRRVRSLAKRTHQSGRAVSVPWSRCSTRSTINSTPTGRNGWIIRVSRRRPVLQMLIRRCSGWRRGRNSSIRSRRRRVRTRRRGISRARRSWGNVSIRRRSISIRRWYICIRRRVFVRRGGIRVRRRGVWT